MKKSSLSLLIACMSLHATYTDYTTQANPSASSLVFIKLGAFSKRENAYKAQQKYPFSTHILRLGEYYSLVTDGYHDSHLAKLELRKIQIKTKDAYLLTLYTKNPPKHVPIVKKVTQKPSTHNTLTNYEKARILYHDKRYEEALALFDLLIIENENDINAHLFYAKTLYQLKMLKEAKKSFLSLQSMPLSSMQREEITHYVKAIEKHTKRDFWNLSLSVGAGHTDNINLVTDKETTQYGPMTLQNDTEKKSSTFAYSSLSISHRHHTSMFDYVTTLSNYNELFHTEKGNDVHYLSLSTGIEKQYQDWLFSLPIGANITYLDGKKVGHNFVTNPALSYQATKELKTIFNLHYVDNTSTYFREKDYRQLGANTAAQWRESNYILSAQMGIEDLGLKKSFRYDMDRNTLYGSLFARYAFTTHNFLATSLAYAQESYSYMDPIMGYKRQDTRINTSFSLGRYLTKSSLLKLAISQTQNDSNVNAYRYKKQDLKLQYQYTLRR